MPDRVERLGSCPDTVCQPLQRSDISCYGKNGTLRACMLGDECRLLSWKGDEAWSQPADFLKKESDVLKLELIAQRGTTE